MRIRILLGLLVLSLCLGCSKRVQLAGGVLPPKRPTTLVSLSPSTTEIGAKLYNSIQLVGRTESCNYPPSMVGAVPVVAGVKPNYELIAAKKPSVIFLDSSLYSKADIEKIKGLGSAVMDFHTDSVKEFIQKIRECGTLVMGETEASDYADKIQNAVDTAEASPLSPSPKAIVLTGGNGSYLIDGTKSFQADVLRTVGATPVGPDGERFSNLNPETLLQLNPDYVFLATPGEKKEDGEKVINGFRSDSRFANLKAVKENHVLGIPEDILLRAGGRVDILITALSKVLRGGQ